MIIFVSSEVDLLPVVAFAGEATPRIGHSSQLVIHNKRYPSPGKNPKGSNEVGERS